MFYACINLSLFLIIKIYVNNINRTIPHLSFLAEEKI